MTNNVYQILDDMKEFLRQGDFTNTVSFGDISEVDLDKTTIFPLAHLNIDNAIITEQTIKFDLNLLCMDILDENNLAVDEHDYFYGNDNLQDILNNQLSVLQRLHANLTRGALRDSLLTTEEELSANPFKDRFVNVLAGWQSTITLVVPNNTGRGTDADGNGC
tara:strand:+ start:844 stop:1332 length:489 start_codon:yes stop_codon:yes gene_type:complete